MAGTGPGKIKIAPAIVLFEQAVALLASTQQGADRDRHRRKSITTGGDDLITEADPSRCVSAQLR